jgi:hypothetical protein
MMEFQVEFSIPVSETRLEIHNHTTEDYAATNQDCTTDPGCHNKPTNN